MGTLYKFDHGGKRRGRLATWTLAAAILFTAGCYESDEAKDVQHYLVNATRRDHGLNSLSFGANYLQKQAIVHSSVMCNKHIQTGQPQLFHSDLGAMYGGEAFNALGENVGRVQGSNPRDASISIFGGFMNSPSHRDNILGNWREMGIGAVWCRDVGTFYITQVFRR